MNSSYEEKILDDINIKSYYDLLKIVTGEMREITDDERKLHHTKYNYVTLSDYEYYYQDKIIVIPKGFLTDGSSGGPDYGCSWLFHDYLYSTHKFTSGQECTREEADEVMKQILNNEQIYWYTWLFTKITKLNFLWLFDKYWKQDGIRGPEFLESVKNS